MYNALKQSLFVPAMDKLLNAVATNEKAKAARIAVRWWRVYKFKSSIILSQPHGLCPAEWVAMRFYHAVLTQFDYRHFHDFHEGRERKFGFACYPNGPSFIRWQKLPMRALILAGQRPEVACAVD
jgi:hypothetical protein